MIKIRLTGWLGKKYGKNFTFRGNTLKDGIDMLCANFTDFRKDFIGNEAKYRISVEETPLSEQDIFSHFCGKTIKIIPVFCGSGNTAKVIAGVVLVAIGAFTGFTPVAQIGWSLIIGGAIGLLFGTPKTSGSGGEDSSKTSYLFSGTVNTTGQGNPVPFLYGKKRIGSQVVSAGISPTMA